MSKDFKYHGFLSYSHKDQKFGTWLHSEIEAFKVPSDLVGIGGPNGTVPSDLAPIFRDRLDLEAGHSLNEKITAALHDSASLIVMCSPASAQSEAVNEEIRLFKASGRSRHIYPIIVSGTSDDDSTGAYFPPMLTAVIGPDGQPTGEEIYPIAADARDLGDGKELAFLKVIAGLLGVNLDDLRKREERARLKELRQHKILAITMALLAIAAVCGWLHAWDAKEEAETQKQTAQKVYEESLTHTLRLAISNASYRAQINSEPFQLSNDESKDRQDPFKQCLSLDPRGSDYVYFRISQILVEFANQPPADLGKVKLKNEWLANANQIINKLLAKNENNSEYIATKGKIELALTEL